MKKRLILGLTCVGSTVAFDTPIVSTSRRRPGGSLTVKPVAPLSTTTLRAKPTNVSNDGRDESKGKKGSKGSNKKGGKRKGKPKSKATAVNDKQRKANSKKKKDEIMVKLKAKLEKKRESESKEEKESLLSTLNPFQAGKKIRDTIGQLTSLGTGLTPETKRKYYLDDRFLEGSGALFSERNPYLDRQDKYVPEVLVVGATGEVGRLVVRRLLLEGKFRVRVLVRDLYSQTLNLLGTGVTYCQGDLSDIESLEYALTDVDKIVFCAGAPRPDESDFQQKFKKFAKENLGSEDSSMLVSQIETDRTTNDIDWEKLTTVLEVRAQLAEQVDYTGVQNIVHAYQNVRLADYGTSQAAKRSLFKFSRRPDDFELFSLDMDVEEGSRNNDVDKNCTTASRGSSTDHRDTVNYEPSEFNYDDYECEEDTDEEEVYRNLEVRRESTVQSQVRWLYNKFGNGVFVGRVPDTSVSGLGGEAAITSSRLQSRESPDMGIDLSEGFHGFIVRLCGDGSEYEAFVRTKEYDDNGIEYVCAFSTATKRKTNSKSQNKFLTRRLPFEQFKPVVKREWENAQDVNLQSQFSGADVRYLGFRYRSRSNKMTSSAQEGNKLSFYLALSYIKVYRLQPEPEFLYLSDARIPPIVTSRMVRHDSQKLLSLEESESFEQKIEVLDETALMRLGRSHEETYFKYRGEETIKSSGLSYTIVRVPGYNELPSGETSTIDLKTKNTDLHSVSRDEVAQVCVSALLDPNALNKSVYMGKKKSAVIDEDISRKFAAIPSDTVD